MKKANDVMLLGEIIQMTISFLLRWTIGPGLDTLIVGESNKILSV